MFLLQVLTLLEEIRETEEILIITITVEEMVVTEEEAEAEMEADGITTADLFAKYVEKLGM